MDRIEIIKQAANSLSPELREEIFKRLDTVAMSINGVEYLLLDKTLNIDPLVLREFSSIWMAIYILRQCFTSNSTTK